MNNFRGCIDTDIGIGSILSNFETPWIMHTVQDSLNMKFRPFGEPMPNFVDIINRQFNILDVAGVDYKDKVQATREETYKEIISCICDYYNMVFAEPFENLSPTELYGVASTIYDIFISRFTDYMIDFYVKYIMQNIDSIYTYLISDDNIRKPKEKDSMSRSYIDPKFMLIHANLNKVILNTTSYDFSLEDLLHYFTDQSTADRLSQLLVDTGDIYKYHYAIYLQDQRYVAELLTSIKLRLQAKTQQPFIIGNN